jgi:hypothetical protein
MQLSFPSNKSIEMTFKVGIAGTQTPPQNVSVVLEKDGTALSYHAAKGDGDDWTARIDNPGKVFGLGEVNLRVSVLLNNRLFTPMKSIAQIIEEVEADSHIPEPDSTVRQDTPEVVPAADAGAGVNPEPEVEIEVKPEVEAVDPKLPADHEFKPEPPKPVKSDEEKRKEVKDLLAKAQEEADKKKASIKVDAPVRMQLLKSIQAGPDKKADPKTPREPFKDIATKPTSEKPVREAVTPVFSMKRTKIVFK